MWKFEGINFPHEAAGLTFYEFYHLKRVADLKEVDEDFNMHRLAFYMQQVQETVDDPGQKPPDPKKKPIPQKAKYGNLHDFYDYSGVVDSVQQGVSYVPKEVEKKKVEKQKANVDDQILDMLEEINKKTK